MALTYLNHNNIQKDVITSDYQMPDLEKGCSEMWNNIQDVYLNPYFAPLMAKDFRGLPETYVFTGEYDLLRDDGLLYSHRLKEAGVIVREGHCNSGFHSILFASVGDEFVNEGQRYFNDIILFLRNVAE